MLKLGKMKNCHCYFFLKFFSFSIFFNFFKRKTKWLVKPVDKSLIFDNSPQQWCQNFDKAASTQWH